MDIVNGRNGCPRNTLTSRHNWNRVELGHGRGDFQVVLEPYNIPQIKFADISTITSLGKQDGRTQLAPSRHGNDHGMYFQYADSFDEAGQWKFVPTKNGYRNHFTIQSTKSSQRTYLSASGHCGHAYIDLWFRDDNNGLQHWYVEPSTKKEGAYTIRHGRNCPRQYISSGVRAERPDLWSDNWSDVQQFAIAPWNAYNAPKISIASSTFINAMGKTDALTYLAAQSNNCSVPAWLKGEDDWAFHNSWKATPVAGKKNVFVFTSERPNNCPRNVLSVSGHCGHRHVDLWHRDDGQGLQHWLISKAEGVDGQYNIKVGGRSHCRDSYLSFGDRANRVDLVSVKNTKNQRFSFTPNLPPAPIVLPESARLQIGGKIDGRTDLAGSLKCNINQGHVSNPDQFDGTNRWTVKPVAGEANTFTLENRRNCDRRYMSNSSHCGHTYVDLWFRDDKKGLQWWKFSRVEGQDNVYWVTNVGR